MDHRSVHAVYDDSGDLRKNIISLLQNLPVEVLADYLLENINAGHLTMEQLNELRLKRCLTGQGNLKQRSSTLADGQDKGNLFLNSEHGLFSANPCSENPRVSAGNIQFSNMMVFEDNKPYINYTQSLGNNNSNSSERIIIKRRPVGNLTKENYSYYFPLSGIQIYPKSDKYLSINTCAFEACKLDPSFSYESYHRYLRKELNIHKQGGLLFAPSSYQSRGVPLQSIIDDEWIAGIQASQFFDPSAVWRDLKNLKEFIPDGKFRCRYFQAQQIENLTDGQFAILTFGQYKQIHGFLKRYNVKSIKWREHPEFNGWIRSRTFGCKFGIRGEDACNKKLTVVLDLMHRIVILKFFGRHISTCDTQNRKLVYPVFRNLVLNHKPLSVDKTFRLIKDKYPSCFDDIIMKLGRIPTTPEVANWQLQREKNN